MNQCIRLMVAFVKLSKIRPVKEVKLTTVGFISILGNLRSVNIGYFNKRKSTRENYY